MKIPVFRAALVTVCIALSFGCSRSPSAPPDSRQSEEVSLPGAAPVKEEDSIPSVRLKGYFEVSELLTNRIIVNRDAFSLGSYLNLDDFEFSNPVHILMGGYDGFGIDRQFKNSKPNAVSMLLWRVTLLGLAKDLSRVCTTAPDADFGFIGNLQARVASDLLALCQVKRDEVRSREIATNVWLDLMAFDAPQDESAIWIDFLFSNERNVQSPERFVETSLAALFLNPYFLMRPN